MVYKRCLQVYLYVDEKQADVAASEPCSQAGDAMLSSWYQMIGTGVLHATSRFLSLLFLSFIVQFFDLLSLELPFLLKHFS